MGIARRSAYTFGAQLITVALALISSIVVSRWLGPGGRGLLALFGIVIQTSVAFATLGVAFSFAYLVGKRRYSTPELCGAATALSLGLWFVVALAAIPLQSLVLTTVLVGMERWHYWLAVAALPLAFLSLMLGNIMLGEGRIEERAVISTLTGVVGTTLTVVFLVVLKGGLGSAMVAVALATLLQAAMYWSRTAGRHGISWKRLGSVTRDAMSFGLRIYFGNLASHFWLRADVYLLNLLAGPTAIGHYTLSTSLAERVWMLEGSVVPSILPEIITKQRREAANLAARASRNLFLLATLLSVSLAAAAPWLIPFLYGAAFRPAVLPLVLLLPGVIGISTARIFSGYYSGQLGRPLTVSIIALITATTAAIAYMILIPGYGAAGAAVGSSIAYITPLLIYLVLFPRDTGIRVRDLLIVRRSDLKSYGDLLRRLRLRLRGRSGAAA